MKRDRIRVHRGPLTYVGNLDVGDIVADEDGFFEVVQEPETIGDKVKVYLRRLPTGVYTKAFVYPKDSRVKLAS